MRVAFPRGRAIARNGAYSILPRVLPLPRQKGRYVLQDSRYRYPQESADGGGGQRSRRSGGRHGSIIGGSATRHALATPIRLISTVSFHAFGLLDRNGPMGPRAPPAAGKTENGNG